MDRVAHYSNKAMNAVQKQQIESPKAGLVPDLCRLPVLFAVVVGAELLAIVLTLGGGRPFDRFWQDLSLLSLYVQWIALGSAGVLCLLRGWLRRQGVAWAALVAWSVVLAVTAAVSEAVHYLGVYQGLSRFDLLLRSLGVSAVVGVFLVHYFHLHYRWRRQLMAEHEARLQALQSRIRPHFLFNSMNTIASLTRTDPALAEEVTQDLADLFRTSLSDARRRATLGDELDLARGYLNIERQRLGDRLEVVWEVDGLPPEAVLPPLIMQPLLENAVYHGIEPSAAPGRITLSGRYHKGRVSLAIRNTLPEGGAERQRPGNRMALDNIRQRLAAMFDDNASLVESSADGEYQVRLVFPHPWRAV